MWDLEATTEFIQPCEADLCMQMRPSSRGSAKVLGSRTRTGRRVETVEGTGLGGREALFRGGVLGRGRYGNSNNWLFLLELHSCCVETNSICTPTGIARGLLCDIGQLEQAQRTQGISLGEDSSVLACLGHDHSDDVVFETAGCNGRLKD